MPYDEFDVSLTKDTFFNTLTFSITTDDIISYLQSSIKYLMEKYSISKSNIKDLRFSRISTKNNNIFQVTIRFCNIDNVDFQGLNEETKIRVALKHMGFADYNIKSISYKIKGKPTNYAWCIRLADPDYNFDPDESFSARNYESHMYKKLREILGFEIEIDFI